jgi:hypothetical protein
MLKVALFDHQSAAEMMATAMDLEKGALRFYTRVREAFSDQDWAVVSDHRPGGKGAYADPDQGHRGVRMIRY